MRFSIAKLVEININSNITLFFADRNIIHNGNIYEDYIYDIEGIEKVYTLDLVSFRNSNIKIKFKNDQYKNYKKLINYADEYPFERAKVKIFFLHDGNTIELKYIGILEQPINIDDQYFECYVSSKIHAIDNFFSPQIITKEEFPYAYEDIGKTQPIIYGRNILVPTLWVNAGAKSTLVSSITNTATTIELSDASRFPTSGAVWIDSELITYTGKAGNNLIGCLRGQGGTTASAHNVSAEVLQSLSTYQALIACHNIHSIGDVFAEIDGKLIKVLSGVSYIESNGKAYINITSRIKIDISNIHITDNINVIENINFTSSTTTKTIYPNAVSSYLTDNPSYIYDGTDKTKAYINQNGWITALFPSTSYGTITRQYAFITALSGEFDVPGWAPSRISPLGVKTTYRLQKTGGNWNDSITCNLVSGYLGGEINEIWKEVEYTPILTKSGTVTKTGTISADGTVYTKNIRRFYVYVNGHIDSSGNIIERPDEILKHFLITYCGFNTEDINLTSFSNAGNFYVSNNIKQAIYIDKKIKASELIMKIAYESRSVIKYTDQIYLQYIPDTIPIPKKIIYSYDCAEKIKYNKTNYKDIANKICFQYKKSFCKVETNADYLESFTLSNINSQNKYGILEKIITLDLIQDQNTANIIANSIINRLSTPKIIAELILFYEHNDLEIFDTIQINDEIYNGKKFYITEMRQDKTRIKIKALEW